MLLSIVFVSCTEFKYRCYRKNLTSQIIRVYSLYMAKRSTGIEKMKTSRSKKTKKRLDIKKERLAALAVKRKRK